MDIATVYRLWSCAAPSVENHIILWTAGDASHFPQSHLELITRLQRVNRNVDAMEMVKLSEVYKKECFECRSSHHRIHECPSLKDVLDEIRAELAEGYERDDLSRMRDALYSVVAYRKALDAGRGNLSLHSIKNLYTMYIEGRQNEAGVFLQMAENGSAECAECLSKSHCVYDCPRLNYLDMEVCERMQDSLEKEDYYRLHTILWSLGFCSIRGGLARSR
eukprot:jgi/Botrbrau1/21689/Bobra.43_1s0085.1